MKLNILLVEDDELEAMKFNRALNKLGFSHTITRAKNGEEALNLAKDKKPNLILLDLNMPKMNGLEFLSILKSDDNHKFIPIIIFSTSNNQVDMLQAYKIGVAGYIVKPLDYKDYVEQIKRIIDYWTINELVIK
ncbi:response regulator [Pseudofulvibacter geojedonensis]|uniref:Response regulator n=1 Tax=Pseudofulvibacter geojedonensis TaxID=1123758 RepID=A0ABW3I5E9_9FLAO